MSEPQRMPASDDRSRYAETVLRRLGYARIEPGRRVREPGASFWVQESGVPRRTFPVFLPARDRASLADGIGRWLERLAVGPTSPRRAIFVAPSDAAAEEAWDRLSAGGRAAVEHDVSILVVPPETADERAGHFALRRASPRELLAVATGVVVGLFRRARDDDGTGSIDFAEMLQLLRGRFGIDVHRSLGVRSDEDALYVLYQLAQRYAYAPGDAGSNLHVLVLKPSGPAARVPWFAG
ncbi:MAG TPA: hypothetical protein VEH10_00605 [Thermoplasmata archaeon]|nr:hypothetical protein [Thermoplasmata archaeon]